MAESVKKVSYDPILDKRWHISSDELSRARLKQIREIQLQVIDGFRYSDTQSIPIAFSVFGSLTKGKILTSETAAAADIDLVIFL